MFHRVKSEPSNAQSQDNNNNQTQTETKAAAPVQQPAQPVTQQPVSQTQTTTTKQKDTAAMNQSATQTPNAKDESKAEKSGEYAAPSGYRASAAPARPGFVGNSYPSYAAAQAAQKKAEQEPVAKEEEAKPQTKPVENSRLTIGPGITMSGEIEYCDTLIVEGTVEAALKGARTLEVLESGVFYGAVSIEEATISGRFEGDITATGRLTITSTGTVTGSITYGALEVESGAVVEGKIAPVKVQDAQRQERTQAGREASAMARGGNAQAEQEAANAQGGELFSHTS